MLAGWRLLLLLGLAASSAGLWWLVPEPPVTLAEVSPAGALFYFEVHPESTFAPDATGFLSAPFQDDIEWPDSALPALSPVQRQAIDAILSDAATRLALLIFQKPGRGDQVGFMIIATASRRYFESLTVLADDLARNLLQPAAYVELEKNPKLGVIVGPPPRRLYRYEEYPFLVLANDPELVTQVLRIRHKDGVSLAGTRDFKRVRSSIATDRGALLYVHFSGLEQPNSALPASMAAFMRGLELDDWRVVVYHWSRSQGQPVKRVVLLRE